jgi:RNA polymerase sigma-70 factor (ECF subfamily)
LPYEEISVILKTSIGGLKANYFHAAKKIGEYVSRAHRTRSI